MNLVVYAVPFFILAMVFELAYGHFKRRNTYRLNDSLSSLFLGILSQARRFVTLGVGGYAYYLITEYFSLPLMDTSYWLTWVVALVLYDLCYYWLHRMGHERTILWAAHVAHHQSEDYNLSTALRQTSTGFIFGWIFYLPMFLLGIPAEVVVTVGSINLIYQFWVHTEHVGKLGWYEKIFITASNHRVHHAQNDIYLDKNYGGIFILWDRIFGTFQEELDEEPVVFGIRGPLKSWNPVKALTHIYVDMAKDSFHTKKWSDKLRVWVSRTGWRPEDVIDSDPREKTDLSNFTRYDPKVSKVVSCYAFFQLLGLLALGTYMQEIEPGYWTGVSYWALLLSTAVITAFWLEARSAAELVKWEVFRLLGFGVLLVSLGAITSAGAAAGFAIYALVNTAFLPFLARSEVPENAVAA
jgi:sterol desaturase/sphingolipid hydroxylase (fatty acid hydroxylase superfamily)